MKASRITAGLCCFALGLGAVATAQAQTVLRVGWTNTFESHYGVAIKAFGR